MGNKRVLFDGKNLFFDVDGVCVVNGKLAESFDLNEDYLIGRDSLSKLVAALSENTSAIDVIVMSKIGDCGYSSIVTHYVYTNDQIVSRISEENAALIEENMKLRIKIDFLNSLINQHNDSNFLDRMREIRKEGRV